MQPLWNREDAKAAKFNSQSEPQINFFAPSLRLCDFAFSNGGRAIFRIHETRDRTYWKLFCSLRHLYLWKRRTSDENEQKKVASRARRGSAGGGDIAVGIG
jgi:hypothetical protein